MGALTRLAAVSVDLDEIPNYFGIHGIEEPAGAVRTLVYDVAVGRLVTLATELEIPLTLFAIGRDLERPEAASQLRDAIGLGFEIGNHTFDHRYDLVRLGADEIRLQVEEGARAIERATGHRPVGFRSPGYTVTDVLLDMLPGLGMLYDTSVFPCPLYWLAKATKLQMIAALGRRSRSVLDSPAVLRAPTKPYRVGRPYWTRGTGIVEMPVGVTRGPRLPFIGTTLSLAGVLGAQMLARMCVGEPMINLEMHGIDVLDESDGLGALRPHQVDVRIPWKSKVSAFRSAVEVLRAHGYSFVTLGEVAQRFR
ncbi:MAG: polysaccharide deacetylase family protein [Polyangiaceae bacterium]